MPHKGFRVCWLFKVSVVVGSVALFSSFAGTMTNGRMHPPIKIADDRNNEAAFMASPRLDLNANTSVPRGGGLQRRKLVRWNDLGKAIVDVASRSMLE